MTDTFTFKFFFNRNNFSHLLVIMDRKRHTRKIMHFPNLSWLSWSDISYSDKAKNPLPFIYNKLVGKGLKYDSSNWIAPTFFDGDYADTWCDALWAIYRP